MFKRMVAIVLQRCPICLQGKLFRSLLGMNVTCPVCGLQFEREVGYFLNSMFAAYTVGFLVLAPSAFLLAWMDVSIAVFAIAITVETIVLWPIIFRHSRVLFLHINQVIYPLQPE